LALISCPECSSQVSDKAPACPQCGAPIAAATAVKVRFPVVQGQMFNTCCSVLVGGRVVAQCRQGETATFDLSAPAEIQVKVTGSFGKPTIWAQPGDRFEVGFRGFYQVFIAKVDVVT
jgi:hypothetical protein